MEIDFDQLEDIFNEQTDDIIINKKINYCSTCDITMVCDRGSNQLICEICGQIEELSDKTYDEYDKNNMYVEIVKNGKVRSVNIGGDNSVQMGNVILADLLRKDAAFYETYNYHIVNKEIASKVISIYSHIKSHTKKTGGNSRIKNRDQIIAALIYYVSNNNGYPKEPKEVELLMQINSFCKGDQFIINLCNENVIDLDISFDNTNKLIEKRLEMLGIENTIKNRDFVRCVLDDFESNGILMEKKFDTKLAGVLWVLVEYIGFRINKSKFEKIVKKKESSYKCIIKYVNSNKGDFKHAFIKHNL